jgi:hypothetical protein
MFIYSVRASTLRFFAILAVTVCVLIGVMAVSGADSVSAMSDGAYRFADISTKEDRLEFLSQFGIRVAADSETEEGFTMPNQLDRVLLSYNEIQKAQGLDLAKYKKKTVTRYTYEVTNYPDYKGTVHANVIVYRNRVIGGDICTADMDGFIHGFEKKN